MKHLVITVHGIRTFGAWQERLERLLNEKCSDRELTFLSYKHGYFSTIAFILPFMRWFVVRRFKTFLRNTLEKEQWDRVDLVSHSFGTHLVGWALYGLNETIKTPVNVTLAGSVLKSNFPWQVLLDHSVRRVVNDCGTKDNVLLLNQMTVLFTGMAGRLGFNGGTGQTFRNRFFEFGHSGYFLTDKKPDNAFMERYWLPLLLTDDPPELVDER